MVIYDLIIPKELQSNQFVNSLHVQFQRNGELSRKQYFALKDMLEIDEDFYNWDFVPAENYFSDEYNILKEKLLKDRFRKVKTKNVVIRAMQAIIDGAATRAMLDEAIHGTQYKVRRRW